MTPATPVATFVVTCHNLGRFLDQTVSSLLAQTRQDFEIVVVNDGSTDGATCRLLAGYRRERTTVVHSERLGLPGARNLGARHAAGRYLCMVDADDLLEPRYLERSVAVLDSQPDLAFASHWLRAFGEEQWEWTPEDCTLPAVLLANTLNGAALLRREVFDRLGGFDESLTDGCEDWEFWIRLLGAGYSGTIIPEFLFRYRRRADSMSREMHAVPGIPGLTRQLVERHPDVFAAHLPALLEARDREIAEVSAGVWRLEREWVADVAGRSQWEQDNRREAAGSDALAQLGEALKSERALIDALRMSWSWRVTAPLRAVLGWVRR